MMRSLWSLALPLRVAGQEAALDILGVTRLVSQTSASALHTAESQDLQDYIY